MQVTALGALLLIACALLGCGSAGDADGPRIEPDPRHAGDDRSVMQDDGCLIKLHDTAQRPCVYGDRHSNTTVVLFGDSLAMAYFPAIDALAKQRHWRLVGLTKMGCAPVATTLYNHRLERDYRECATWRRQTLKRIEKREHPDLILTTGRMSTPATRNGHELGVRASRAALERGYVKMLKRLRRTGAAVVALKDLPASPFNVPDCVAKHPSKLRRCTFRSTPENTERLDSEAVAAVAGVKLIDVTPLICPGGRCHAVIDHAIVFRDYDHMTPTFARKLAKPIGAQLPPID